MPETYRIFISSPGDVGEERVIAGRVVDRLAGEFSRFFELEAILWEHEPLRATGHFQEQITRPSDADLVVCILWSRLGTRLPEQFRRKDGGRYASGTEWEFEDAAEAFREHGTPDLLVYRKTREAVADLTDRDAVMKRLEQKEALDAFIDRWFGSAVDSFKAAFHTFMTPDEFESMLEEHVRRLISERVPAHLVEGEPAGRMITWHKGSPFRGLETFDVEHAPVFFGRTRAVAEIKEALATRSIQGVAFLVVFGMSGSGKTSLVRAGVLPTITEPGVIEQTGLWRSCVVRPTDFADDLFEGLAQALTHRDVLPEITEATDALALPRYLRGEPEHAARQVADALTRAAQAAVLRSDAKARLALVVDQLEELFTLESGSAEDRSAFVAALGALAQSGYVWVIGTMRSDFYHRCAEVPELVALTEGSGQYHLLPPSPAECAQVIRGPARAAGLRFEVDVETGERLDDVLHGAVTKDTAALPLLEFTLEELFKQRTDDSILTFDAYRRLGGLEGAIGRRAEEVRESLPDDPRAELPAVLRSLVTIDPSEGQPTARRVSVESVTSSPARKRVVDAFVDARLFVTDTAGDGTAVVRLAHEALLRHWARLAAWLDEDVDFLRTRARVADAAAHWRREDDNPDFLLAEGKPLSEAEALIERRDELDGAVIDFVDQSIAAHRRRLEAREAAARRRLRQAWTVAGVVAVLAIFAAIGGYLGFTGQKEAERQAAVADRERERAVSERNQALTTQSLFLADLAQQRVAAGDATTGILLSLEALPRDMAAPSRPYVAEAEVALHDATYAQREKAVLEGHAQRVHWAAYSPDEKRIATASYDGTVRLWDAASGEQVGVLVGHENWVTRVAYSPDGTRLLTASDDGTARLWDADSGVAIATLRGHEKAVRHAAFSPDGESIATASWDGTVGLWDADGGERIAVLRGHEDRVNHVTYSPDGRLIASVSADTTLRLWDAETRELLKILRGHEDDVMHAVFSPDGERIVTTSVDKTARMWDVASGTQTALLDVHRDTVRYAAFSPDGSRLVTMSWDGTAHLWNGVNGRPIFRLEGHGDWVLNGEFSPDGRRIVTASRDGTARLWNVVNGQSLAVLGGHSDWVLHAAFSPDGSRVVTSSRDRKARLWDAVGDARIAILEGHRAWLLHAAYSPDGRRIVTASDDGTARLWNAGDGTPVGVLEGHTDDVVGATFAPDSTRLVTASKDHTAAVWDAETGDRVAVLAGHRDAVVDAAFSHDGTRVATGSADDTARLWDAESGAQLAILRGHERTVTSVAFSPDDLRLATVSYDRTVRIWNARSGAELNVLRGHADDVRHVAFSPDGRWVLSASNDRTARLWDAASGETVAVMEGHEDWVVHAGFDPEGARIVTASGDGTARLWSVPTGEVIAVLSGHEDWVSYAEFSPDGRRVITASDDDMARLWDAATGLQIAVLTGHARKVTHAAFSPDGNQMVTTSQDRIAQIFPLFDSTQDLIDHAGTLVPRRLSDRERREFFLEIE